VLADQHDREARGASGFAGEVGSALRHALTEAGGEGLSVNQPRGHHMP
jgi:hypothetical protein